MFKFLDFSSVFSCQRVAAAPIHAVMTAESLLLTLLMLAAFWTYARMRGNDLLQPGVPKDWVPSRRTLLVGLAVYAVAAVTVPAVVYGLRDSGLAVIMMHVCAPQYGLQGVLQFCAVCVIVGLIVTVDINSDREERAQRERQERAQLKPMPWSMPQLQAMSARQEARMAARSGQDWGRTSIFGEQPTGRP